MSSDSGVSVRETTTWGSGGGGLRGGEGGEEGREGRADGLSDLSFGRVALHEHCDEDDGRRRYERHTPRCAAEKRPCVLRDRWGRALPSVRALFPSSRCARRRFRRPWCAGEACSVEETRQRGSLYGAHSTLPCAASAALSEIGPGPDPVHRCPQLRRWPAPSGAVRLRASAHRCISYTDTRLLSYSCTMSSLRGFESRTNSSRPCPMILCASSSTTIPALRQLSLHAAISDAYLGLLPGPARAHAGARRTRPCPRPASRSRHVRLCRRVGA